MHLPPSEVAERKKKNIMNRFNFHMHRITFQRLFRCLVDARLSLKDGCYPLKASWIRKIDDYFRLQCAIAW